MTIFAVACLIFIPMIIETALARRNERAQEARGGLEAQDPVYKIMRIVYPAAFLAMLAESATRGIISTGSTGSTAVVIAGVVVFAAAKVLKWSAIRALGRCWTFRVIVVPGDTLVASGPYRYLRHPNYVGVIGELTGAALMTRALLAGPISVIVFAVLLHKRIAVEERALKI